MRSEGRGVSPTNSTIELKVERIGALFDAFDPFPMPSRDLSSTAEDFIVDWAREFPQTANLRIVIHGQKEADLDEALLREAFRNHFLARARRVEGDLRELFRFARLALAIGLAVLALCVVAARVATLLISDVNLARIVSEGLLILGWVVNWRPIELLLYDWWPLRRRRNMFRRLAQAPVQHRVA